MAAKFGYVSDLTPAQIKEDVKWMKRARRRAKVTKAKMATKSFFDRYTVEVVGGAVLAAASFAWIMHRKKTTGSIW